MNAAQIAATSVVAIVVIIFVAVLIVNLVESERLGNVICPQCKDPAFKHSSFSVQPGWEFAASLHHCEATHEETDERGIVHLIECKCTLSQDEVRVNAEHATAAVSL